MANDVFRRLSNRPYEERNEFVTFYYFCIHPYILTIFCGLQDVVRRIDPDSRNILILSRHPYFHSLEYKTFLSAFDEVYEVGYAEYSKNIIRAVQDALRFRREMRDIRFREGSIAFTISYADIVTNLFCKCIMKSTKNRRLIHLTAYGNFLDLTQGIFDWVRTAADWVVSILAGAYVVKTYRDIQGNVHERVYLNDPHDEIYELSGRRDGGGRFPSLPFPVVPADAIPVGRRFVLFFGDSTLPKYYPEITSESYLNFHRTVLRKLVKYYTEEHGIDVLYKSHPLDKEALPSEYMALGVKEFGERITAEMIFSRYRPGIAAVYSVSSTSCLTASHFGIPSYVLFLLTDFREATMRKLEAHFASARRDLLELVNSLDQIGSIDHRKGVVDERHLIDSWRPIIARHRGDVN